MARPRPAAGAASALRRGAVLAVGCLAGLDAGWRLVREPLGTTARDLAGHGWRGVATMGFADVLAAAMAVVLVVCGGWLLAATALCALAGMVRACLACPAAGTGATVRMLGRLADGLDRWSPRAVRRTVALVLGAAVTAGLGAPAHADPGEGGRLAGLELPDRVTGTGTASAAPVTARTATHAPGPEQPPRRVVVVARGDSLWSLAGGLLGAGATDARVDRAWHRLYRANRQAVGADPDLIVPGDRLTVPDLTVPDRKEAP